VRGVVNDNATEIGLLLLLTFPQLALWLPAVLRD